jgi:RND family efflux transporter MFP subunit
MKRWLSFGLLLVLAAAIFWLVTRRAAPPETAFAKAKRETLVSLLATNGKTEPVSWSPIHSRLAGRISQVPVQLGQNVGVGALLAVIENPDTQAELASAQSRLEQARADLANLQRGGRAAELAEIDGSVKRLQLELTAARRESAALDRLLAKQAATKAESDVVKDRIAQLEAQITALQARRAALVGQNDVSVAEARVRDAEAAVAQAKRHAEEGSIRSPRAGIVYDLPAKAGAWLGEGDLVAKVGDTSKLRVTVYIDEPDLGRIRKGLPVNITWDAETTREWQGTVEQIPPQVISMGTRQVGEVLTLADNPNHDLPPGANINARIRTQVVDNALTIPKSALRREDGQLGVFVLDGPRLAWRAIEAGASSETRAEVRKGLKEGDSVALPTERPLKSGMEVTAVYP